jgi:uncharacterized membrane protein
VINLGGLPGSLNNYAYGINDAGQVVGYGGAGDTGYATEWSGGSVIALGGLAGSTTSVAWAINNAGQVVGQDRSATPHTPSSGVAGPSSTSVGCPEARIAQP